MLDTYKALLRDYHVLIGSPDWHASRLALVAQMDKVWAKLTRRQRDLALQYAHDLYLARVRG